MVRSERHRNPRGRRRPHRVQRVCTRQSGRHSRRAGDVLIRVLRVRPQRELRRPERLRAQHVHQPGGGGARSSRCATAMSIALTSATTSRAGRPENHILYNRIMDEADGDAKLQHRSARDRAFLRPSATCFSKGPLNDNQPAFISYGVENTNNADFELYRRQQYVRQRRYRQGRTGSLDRRRVSRRLSVS